MPACPHCARQISSEAWAALTHCRCGAPMVGKIPPDPVVLVPPEQVEATQEAMPAYDVRPTEKLPERAGHARRRRGR